MATSVEQSSSQRGGRSERIDGPPVRYPTLLWRSETVEAARLVSRSIDGEITAPPVDGSSSVTTADGIYDDNAIEHRFDAGSDVGTHEVDPEARYGVHSIEGGIFTRMLRRVGRGTSRVADTGEHVVHGGATHPPSAAVDEGDTIRSTSAPVLSPIHAPPGGDRTLNRRENAGSVPRGQRAVPLW